MPESDTVRAGEVGPFLSPPGYKGLQGIGLAIATQQGHQGIIGWCVSAFIAAYGPEVETQLGHKSAAHSLSVNAS